MSLRIILSAVCILGLAFGTGCSSLTKSGGSKKDSAWGALQFWKKGYQQPQKMAVLWSHDILTVAGKPPTRGFGGRIYFYNNKSQTIPVEGELVVHGFDETNKRKTGGVEAQADKRFRFTEEQFTGHFSESDLGASYSVWIPWDTAEGVQKEITLVPTFKSSKGELVQGDAAKVVLPGRAGSKEQFSSPVQTVSYEQSTSSTADGPLPQLSAAASGKKTDTMRTTTIQMAPPRHNNARGSRDAGDRSQGGAPAPLPSQSPAAASALDQARAKLIEDAFRQAETPAPRPAPTYSAWTPSNVQMAGTTSVNANNLMPTPWTQGQSQPGQGQPGQSQPGQGQQVQAAGQNLLSGNVIPAVTNFPRPQTSIATGPTGDEGIVLPPGVQLSPRGTAW